MADTVTVGKAHFEALFRRAEFYSAGSQYYESFNPHNVTIPATEYESLRRSANEYETLKDALLGGGITTETLDILVRKVSNTEQARKDSGLPDISKDTAQYPRTLDENYPARLHSRNSSRPASSGAPRRASGHPERHSSQEYLQIPGQGLTWQQQRDFGSRPYSPLGFDDFGDDSVGFGYNQAQDNQDTSFSRGKERTLLITGLSDRITYKDLTDVIRGGRILYINIRTDRTATVFMLEGAAEFLAHVKRHDLYVQTKRLEVKWSEHQFHMAPYVGRQIVAGASRNLVIRSAAHAVSLADIREHMEHIHKFDIVHIDIRGRDVFIYTNSVHNALFARTCMLSRKPYKGFKIEFFPDECAAPLPVIQSHHANKRRITPAKKQPTSNLFEMLSLDSDEENLWPGRHDDDDNTLGEDDTVDGTESEYGVGIAA